MGSSQGEEPKKMNGDDSCNYCGRTKRTIYGRSSSFPSASIRPRPSASLCRSKSDISPPPSFRSLWSQLSSVSNPPTPPPAPASAPAPAYSLPPAAMISPGKETRSPWEKSKKSSVSPPTPAAVIASPVFDLLSPDPFVKTGRMMEQQRKVRRKIDTNAYASASASASQDKDATSPSPEVVELETLTKGETLKISISCSCGSNVACNIALI